MTVRHKLLVRISLGILWIFTGITSAFLAPEIGYEVLANGGITGRNASTLIFLDSGLDIVIGLWVLSGWQLKSCCLVQLGLIFSYSLLLSFIEPGFWLHPFGPLTKNIPIAVFIFVLYSTSGKTKN
jgi:hypothetical protein